MIKNIIFDFGDIFVNLDKAATLRELNQLGMAHPDPELMKLFLAYEKGSFSTGSFLEKVKPFFPHAAEEQLKLAWNAILLDFPEYRLEFLESLVRDGSYRMFLLSNTNELHMAHVEESMGRSRFARFTSCFESVCLSHELQMRKPEPEIFRYMMERFALDPVETFFVDDTLENVQSAARLGIRVWHLIPEEEDIITLGKKIKDA